MNGKIKYSDEPVRAEVVRDFLPPPDQLVAGEEWVKVTISLSRRSVEFFKEAAERNQTSYQRMIRRLLDTYADHYRGEPAKRSSERSNTRTAQR
ncbi:MAG: hypothetical protein CALGDGBN_03216 [Pseudomonadales bacterium]|nr:hypothetical protein [Pseudomonadales bacterium]